MIHKICPKRRGMYHNNIVSDYSMNNTIHVHTYVHTYILVGYMYLGNWHKLRRRGKQEPYIHCTSWFIQAGCLVN